MIKSIYLFLIMALLTLSSCEVVGGIFKAGVWVGIFAVVGIVVLILWLVNRKRN